jgi:PAS domain S-box-containing protein
MSVSEEGWMAAASRRSRRATQELEVANWLFENGLDGFLVIRDTLIERVNRRYTQIMGWTSEQSAGRRFWDFVHPDDIQGMREALKALPHEPAVACEHRALTLKGETIWLRSRISSISGTTAVVMVEDISKARREAAVLAEAQRGSELMHAAAGIVMWRYDPDDGQYVTDTGFDLGGATDLAPRSADRVQRDLHPDDVDRVMATWDESLETGAFNVAEYRDLDDLGRWRWLRTAWKGVQRKPSGRWLVEGVTQDITEVSEAREAALRSAEEAQAANTAKSGFLATVSHEIRTPMNGVLGMAQAMAADELTPRQRVRLEVIQRSGETLLSILNDVLDLSKIEAGKLELEEAEFDISEVAASAYNAFAEMAARRSLAYDLTIEEGARGRWRGDATRVRQILYNLISNAVKFTHSGTVQVRIWRETVGALRLAVTDTGIGVPLDRVSQLFGKFVQADTSTTRRYGGSGLGLAICHELVERMGGAIEVRSVVDEGSCFSVRLPLPQIMGTVIEAQAPSEEPAGEGLQALRVLAAEDNEVNQLVLKTLLAQIGIEPVIVENGQQAVEAWEAERWDLILMDVQMPVMDGPTATKAIRAREAARGLARTPIIALTANAMSHQLAEYTAAGMDGLVAKPIEVSKLWGALELAIQLASDGETGAANSA